MRFALSDDVISLRDNLRDVLKSASNPDHVRAAWSDGGRDVIRQLWGVLGELGVLGLLVPEQRGGFGGDEEVMVAVMEEVGYHATPGPVGDTLALVAPVLAASTLVDLTSRVTTGQFLMVVVADDGPTPYGAVCDGLVRSDGEQVRVVTANVEAAPVATVDASRHAAIVRGDSIDLGIGRDVWEAWVERATLAAAAELVGLSQRMIDMTRVFVVEREQFGVPVGSFQAIKHALANCLISVEFARPVVWGAAVALREHSHDSATRVSMAKSMASEAARSVAKAAIQCHGAMGYTVEYDLHLFAKRAWARSADWGDSEHHVERIAQSLGL